MTNKRRPHYEQCPSRTLDVYNPRIIGIARDALRFRALRTTHILMLYSGGECLATLPPGTEGTIVGGPVTVADIPYWKLQADTVTGWVESEALAGLQNVQDPLGLVVSTTQKQTYLRVRPGGSEQKVRRCASDCHHADILMREYEPLDRYRSRRVKGSLPKIYALSNSGADLLADVHDLERGRIDWHQKNQAFKDPQLLHTLARADVLVPLEVHARASGDVRFIETDALMAAAPEATRAQTNPYIWRVSRRNDKGRDDRLSATPDKFFALELLWRPEGRNRRHFLLEADRAKMPNERRTLTRQSSIIKKIIVFGEAFKQELHKKRYHIASFRVLIATTSRSRIKNMLSIVKALVEERGYRSDLFYFNDFETLAQADNSLLTPWITLRKTSKNQNQSDYTPTYVSLLAEQFDHLPLHYQSAPEVVQLPPSRTVDI